MLIIDGKEYKDMSSNDQFIYDTVDFVEQCSDVADYEFTGYAIEVNGRGGFGSMQVLETMDGKEVVVVTSIFGNFEMADMDKCAAEIRFRARFIVMAFMAERLAWHPRTV